MSIISELEKYNVRYPIYEVRFAEYSNCNSKLPFRVSEQPLKIGRDLKKEIIGLGPVLCMYFNAVILLYNIDETVKQILDRGKLQVFVGNIPKYLLLKPELIITDQGLKLCSLETSILGLGLSDILNRSYIDCGYETLVGKNELKDYIQSVIPTNGVIAYSQRTKSFRGQINYLANNIFSEQVFDWQARMVNKRFVPSENVYRAFCTTDCINEPEVGKLLDSNCNFIPSLTPQFEEKAILSFIWDKRYSDFFKRELGKSAFQYLRRIILPMFVVGEEKFFELGLPGNVSNLGEIGFLPKSKRKLVLKKSLDSSWGENVSFLHKTSHKNIKDSMKLAMASAELYIIQEFFESKKIPMNYIVGKESYTMQAKWRITPYYAFPNDHIGRLVSVKATGCENTNYIHGATNSINTSIMM